LHLQILSENIPLVAGELDEPYLETWRVLLNAHASLTGQVEAALAAAGLPPLSWYDVLWSVERRPGKRMRMGDLATSVVTISRSGLTRLVDRIEAEGLLERQPAPDDRRGTEVAITPAGTALLRRMWPVYAGVLRERFAQRLTPEQARAVRDALAPVAVGDA
jgi:DNA-binding MarR family transcriptional regulator